MSRTATYSLIASTTLGSAQTQVDFTSITGTFTDLIVVIGGRVSTDSYNPTIRFNSDSATNYSSTWVAGSGTAVSSSRNSNATSGYAGALGSAVSTIIINIMDYANTTTYKTALVRNSSTTASSNQAVSAWVDLWRSTSAITSVSLITAGGNQWQSGSTFKLYGIQAGSN